MSERYSAESINGVLLLSNKKFYEILSFLLLFWGNFKRSSTSTKGLEFLNGTAFALIQSELYKHKL